MRRPLIALFALAAACSGGNNSRTLVLIHTNDEHSHLLGYGPESDDYNRGQATGTGGIVGGAARRATVFAAERSRAQGLGAASLTVSAGDNMMGTLLQIATTQAAPDYQAMRALGYDVTTLGNHEFDYGPGGLASAIAAAQAAGGMIPVVSTNIHFPAAGVDKGSDALAAFYDDSGEDSTLPVHKKLILTASNGLRVGFVGVVGQDAAFKAPTKSPVTFSLPSCCSEQNAPAVISQMIDDVQASVDELRADKVDVVVLLSHAGVDPVNFQNGEDYALATGVKGIDVIVSGHTHTTLPAVLVKNPETGKNVLIQQAGRFGEYVGRIQLSVDKDRHVSFDMNASTLVHVDDTVADGSPSVDLLVTGVISGLETTPVTPNHLSFLEYTLTESTGVLTQHTAKTGDLFFATMGNTSFDIPGDALHKESQGQILAADAELWAAEAMAGLPSDAAFFAQGAIRADINKGKTGAVSFADLFRVVPLGGSPISGTPGYPLCRFALFAAEIKGALDLVSAGLAQASVSNNDFFLVPAGMKVEYDLTRAPFDPAKDPFDPLNGRVTKISIASDHTNGVYEGPYTVIYDASHASGGKPDPFFGGTAAALKPYTVVTNLYVAVLSSVGGVRLKNATTLAPLATPYDAIIHRPAAAGGTEIKDWEALAGYVKFQSAINGGTMPARYNPAVSTSARRVICTSGSTVCP